MAEEDGGERTEAATPRQLQKAREAGSVAVSREAPVLAALVVFTVMLTLQAPRSAWQLNNKLAGFLDLSFPQDPIAALRAAGLATLVAAGPFLLASLVAVAASVLLQTGGAVNFAALLPNPSRLSPSHGLARLLSPYL